jgi:hypothetical protein
MNHFHAGVVFIGHCVLVQHHLRGVLVFVAGCDLAWSVRVIVKFCQVLSDRHLFPAMSLELGLCILHTGPLDLV